MPNPSEFDSFAIFASCDSGKEIVLSIDINVWINRRLGCDVDFGIGISPNSGSGVVTIFVPYRLEEEQITDLSNTLDDHFIYRSVFNEYRSEINQGLLPEDSDFFNTHNYTVCPLSLACLEMANHTQGGSIIKFRFNAEGQGTTVYYRFRIPIPDLDSTISSPGDFKEVITGPIIPFRAYAFIEINQIRGLPMDIGHALARSQSQIAQVRLALVANVEWSVEAWSTPYKVRQLEMGSWSKYQPKLLPDGHSRSEQKRRYIVYQWEGAGGPSIFQFCLSRKIISARTALFYLLILVGLDLISASIGSMLQHLSPILIALVSKCLQGG